MKKKSAFLILRLPQEIKDEIASRARDSHKSISQYIREHIEMLLHGE